MLDFGLYDWVVSVYQSKLSSIYSQYLEYVSHACDFISQLRHHLNLIQFKQSMGHFEGVSSQVHGHFTDTVTQ